MGLECDGKKVIARPRAGIVGRINFFFHNARRAFRYNVSSSIATETLIGLESGIANASSPPRPLEGPVTLNGA